MCGDVSRCLVQRTCVRGTWGRTQGKTANLSDDMTPVNSSEKWEEKGRIFEAEEPQAVDGRRGVSMYKIRGGG